jgi:glutamyl/glutaminyl-tRNA synthetase
MIRTRFAPSPTGYLHIGGVRTALFNWLFARHHGGQFILRIDDTDQQRNVEEALEPILHGFRWLGLDWDEGPGAGGDVGPYFQSQRNELHQQAVESLLASGHAYYDYSTAEDLDAEREACKADGKSFIYSRRWMATTSDERAKFEAEGRKSVVRMKMPREGVCTINDLIRGEVKFAWNREQDTVIQRNDGSFIYHLASVVDDHLMKISHVIRAEEHLSNTPRQIFIAQSLGYELPVYAHVPFVAEPGGKNKISKRKLDKYLKNREFNKLYEHGKQIADATGLSASAETFNPVIVDFYEHTGYLPAAVLNYLVLLGWSLDDKTEDFSIQEMIENFSLERVNNAAASFDPQKLTAFEGRYMANLPVEDKVAGCWPYLVKAGIVGEEDSDAKAKLAKIVAAAGDRLSVFGDVLDYVDFYQSTEELTYDEKAFQKRLRKPEAAGELLKKFRDSLAAETDFSPASLDGFTHRFVEAEGIKIGLIVNAVRVAVTGKGVGFGLFETLSIIGRDGCLGRMGKALKVI